MNSLSKLWNQLSNVTIYDAYDSKFALYNGYKIEKNNNGKVFIYDTRTHDIFYRKINDIEERTFIENGFKKGADILTIKHYEIRLLVANDKVRHYTNTNKTNKLRQAKADRTRIMNKLNKNFKKWKN